MRGLWIAVASTAVPLAACSSAAPHHAPARPAAANASAGAPVSIQVPLDRLRITPVAIGQDVTITRQAGTLLHATASGVVELRRAAFAVSVRDLGRPFQLRRVGQEFYVKEAHKPWTATRLTGSPSVFSLLAGADPDALLGLVFGLTGVRTSVAGHDLVVVGRLDLEAATTRAPTAVQPYLRVIATANVDWAPARVVIRDELIRSVSFGCSYKNERGEAVQDSVVMRILRYDAAPVVAPPVAAR